jgi:hypothetical protein
MRSEIARDALLATHGGLSLELCDVLYHISPMALYRLVCACGHHSLVTVLTRCGLPLPTYFLADEKHRRCLTDKVYLPTIVRGRVIWHLGYTKDASAIAFTQSYQEFQRVTLLDQAHNAIEWKFFAMQGFHHPGGSQQALLTGLAPLYNLVPYQRRAQHAGQCGVEAEGGRLPTPDWMLNLQILTSGGV